MDLQKHIHNDSAVMIEVTNSCPIYVTHHSRIRGDTFVMHPAALEWYGVGWDIKNDQIKIYFLKNDLSQIYCEEYIRSSSGKMREKLYDVGKKSTIMHKDNEAVNQINSNTYDHEVVNKMIGLGFNLDTYSQYGDKITLYFD